MYPSRKEKLEAIMATKGRIFTVTFIKANGEVRQLNGRLEVKKHLRGGDSTTAHIPNLITVFDMQKKAYRNINLDTLISLRYGHKEVKFNEEK